MVAVEEPVSSHSQEFDDHVEAISSVVDRRPDRTPNPVFNTRVNIAMTRSRHAVHAEPQPLASVTRRRHAVASLVVGAFHTAGQAGRVGREPFADRLERFDDKTPELLLREARAAVDNVRGNAALKKLGAVPEGVLRKCFLASGAYRDHVMWSILAAEWRAANDERAGQATGEVA